MLLMGERQLFNNDDRDRADACSDFSGNILVSAAAGSGKTSSLTKRVINCLSNKKSDNNYVGIENIMMVTFTDAATIEMRGRIAYELEKAAVECSDSALARHYRKQQTLIGNAYISTIHSLCARLVRDNFHLLGIDPKMKLLDENEARLLQQDCVEELFEAHYSNSDTEFLKLVEWFCSDNGDDELHRAVFKLYHFAANRVEDRIWLDNLAENFWPNDAQTISDCAWGHQLFVSAGVDLQYACAEYIRAHTEGQACARLPEVTSTAYEELLYTQELCESAENSDYNNLAGKLAQLTFASWNSAGHSKRSKRVKENADTFDIIKQHIENARSVIGKLRDKFASNEQLVMNRVRASKDIVMQLSKLADEFTQSYRALKRSLGKMDFNDLERYCVELLSGTNAADMLSHMQQRFFEIMTDEYQDTNEVQERILQLLSGGTVRRFMVGDIKQSIYGFRQADPSIFLRKYQSYVCGQHGKALVLTRNFRSRAAVLEATNFIFERIMTEACGGIAYDETSALCYGAEHIYSSAPADVQLLDNATELIIINPDNKSSVFGDNQFDYAQKVAAEAQVIADKINELIRSKSHIFDKNADLGEQWRRLAFRDCAILLRKKSSAAEILTVLRDNGIPCYSDIGSSYFMAYEVRIVLALLAIVDNPLQDIPLAGVLRSPIFEITDTQLAHIRLHSKDVSLWNAVLEYSIMDDELAKKIHAIVIKIKEWRESNKCMRIHELLRIIYIQSRFYDYVAALPSGNIRQANLRMLSEHALVFENVDHKGLFRFLKYIELLRKREQDLEEGKPLSANDDVVRITTTHGSKGLEYPVVFVPEIGREFGGSLSRGLFNLHKNYGIGANYVDIDDNVEYDSLPYIVNEQSIKQEELAEEMRILYVAMTRAREKLFLLGKPSGNAKLANKIVKWQQAASDGNLQPQWVSAQKSWLDWIGAALCTRPDARTVFTSENADRITVAGWNITIKPSESIPLVQPRAQIGDFCQALASCPVDEQLSKDIMEHLCWDYNVQHPVVNLPPKLTVTELKRLGEAALEEQPETGELHATYKKATPHTINAAALGTIYHALFQQLDFHAADYSIECQRVIAQLTRDQSVEIELLQKINPQLIYCFLSSSLAERIRRAKFIKREQQFVLEVLVNDLGIDEVDISGGEKILLQGVLDLLVVEQDGTAFIVDYKTDNVDNSEILIRRYRAQLHYYNMAVRRITNYNVNTSIIWHVPTASELNV